MFENFLSWLTTALKFSTIFISGFAGIMSLLTDFKDKRGRITRAGRIALYVVVISFLISATMQAIEIHQDNQRAVAKANETQAMLESINRQLYKIDEKDISFDVTSELILDDNVFASYSKRLQDYCKSIKKKRPINEVKGLRWSYLNGNGELNGIEIDPGSTYYPDSVKENLVFNIIGKMMLDIKIYKFSKDLGKQLDTPSLSFSTIMAHPKLWYTPGNNTIAMSIDGIKISSVEYSWRNMGDIQSLTDLNRAKLTFTYSDAYFDDPPNDTQEAPKKIEIKSLSINIASRMFNSGHFCSITKNGYISYYFFFPEDILKTHHNMKCP